MVSISTPVFYDSAQRNGNIFSNHAPQNTLQTGRRNGERNEIPALRRREGDASWERETRREREKKLFRV